MNPRFLVDLVHEARGPQTEGSCSNYYLEPGIGLDGSLAPTCFMPCTHERKFSIRKRPGDEARQVIIATLEHTYGTMDVHSIQTLKRDNIISSFPPPHLGRTLHQVVHTLVLAGRSKERHGCFT